MTADIAEGRRENVIVSHAETVRVVEMLDELKRTGGARFPQNEVLESEKGAHLERFVGGSVFASLLTGSSASRYTMLKECFSQGGQQGSMGRREISVKSDKIWGGCTVQQEALRI